MGKELRRRELELKERQVALQFRLERERHRIEKECHRAEIETKQRQIALDTRLRRREIALKAKGTGTTPFWKTTAGVAVLGGIFAILTAITTNYFQARSDVAARRDAQTQQTQEHLATTELEASKFQSELIQSAIDKSADTRIATTKLRFLADTGLIPKYKEEIEGYLKRAGVDTTAPAAVPFTQPPGQSKEEAVVGALRFGEFTGGEYGIIEADNRKQVSDTMSQPYHAVCRVSFRSGGREFFATGFLIAPRLVLTAGFVVYSNRFGWTEEVSVSPGGDDSQMQTSKAFQVVPSAVRGDDVDLTGALYIGAIVLPNEVEGVTPFQLSNYTTSTLKGVTIELAGFPGDKRDHSMWKETGAIHWATDTAIGHRFDTVGGNAGSPIFTQDDSDGSYRVVAIDAFAGGKTGKFGIRVDGFASTAIDRLIKLTGSRAAVVAPVPQ